MYAKLKKGLSSQYLYYAPETFVTPEGEVINNFNSNLEKLQENGFKLVIDNPPKITKNMELFIDGYIETDTTITISYDVYDIAYDFEKDLDSRIQTTKDNLSQFLLENPAYSSSHNGGDYYTATLEKQNQLIETITTYHTFRGTPSEKPLFWNAHGKMSEVWTIDELNNLLADIQIYTKPLVLLQQYLEDALKKCKIKKELDSINLTINHTRANELVGDLLDIEVPPSEDTDINYSEVYNSIYNDLINE